MSTFGIRICMTLISQIVLIVLQLIKCRRSFIIKKFPKFLNSLRALYLLNTPFLITGLRLNMVFYGHCEILCTSFIFFTRLWYLLCQASWSIKMLIVVFFSSVRLS
ncbi:hypothetical protein I3842_03G036800 [Carya illinoinensis]|uniref:Uncharacterized protein n=1 Tax=Carya illinoinensis TaxID=32201 RepID=A0A922JXL6_CARIL|nr:hypothetical protein I3842_03G036800 [Carya illinoinensis]